MVVVSKVVTEEEQQEEEAPIHGDILEAILCHVPLVDLVPASHVSKSWSRAVSSSLRNFNRLKPWLIVHAQTTRPPYVMTTRFYDPRSGAWVKIEPPQVKYVAALRSADSNLAYMLSPSRLAFSSDPLHVTWRDVHAPIMWRTDPIVALVGDLIVVAGGTCDFEDDPLAVEIHDINAGTWSTCDSMPSPLKDSTASTSLSIASNDRKMFVTERHSSMMYSFDPITKIWCGPFNLRPDPNIFYSLIGFSENRLILIGLIGDEKNVKSMKLWEVNDENFECEAISETPLEFVEKLKSENSLISAVNVCLAGKLIYVYNPLEMEEVLMCEFVDGGGCRWGSVRNVITGDRNGNLRFAVTCSEVGMDDVFGALKRENRMLEEREREREL